MLAGTKHKLLARRSQMFADFRFLLEFPVSGGRFLFDNFEGPETVW